MRDRPLWALVAAAAATYPALALGWCVAMLLGTEPVAWRLALAGHPAAMAAVVLVAVGAVAMGGALHRFAGGLWQTRRFHGWVSAHEIPVASPAAALAAEVGLAGRLRLVAVEEQLAVTAGLARPYVVVSTGLARALDGAELRAVLAHEQAHLHRRDPLRLLLARVLVANLWFLPVARDLRGRARCGVELAADRHATNRYGRSALAGALLRIASTPAVAATVVGFGPDTAAAMVSRFTEPALLENRIAQLELGRPPRPAPLAPTRTALTAITAVAFLATVAGACMFVLLACPSGMGMTAYQG